MRRNVVWVTLGAALLFGCQKAEEEAPKPVVDVKVAPVEETDLATTVRGPASVFPREQANVASRLTAPIRGLRVRKGDTVSAGQIIAVLENSDLIAQRDEARAAVTDAEANFQKVTVGTLPTEIERARGQVATSQAALDQARKFYDRRKQLFEQGAIPNRDLLISQTELATAQTNYDVAKKSLELLEGQSKERDIQMARSRLEQARSHLAYLETQLSFAQIHSPFAGTVTEQFVFPGDMAKPDSPIFTIADLSIAVARAQIPEAESGAVRKGQSCSLAPADQPDSSSAGRVSVVNQAVDPARRTVEVWCEIRNGSGKLRAGVFGSLSIVTGTLTRSLAVPLAAVQFDEGSRSGFVMTVGADRKAKKKAIEAGPTTGGKVPILKGLAKGEMVIVEAGYGLPDGTDVKLPEAKKE